jgi:predicted Rossmann fold flavoprotein
MANIPVGGKFLYSALNRFPPEQVMSLFENLGVPLKTERGNRVFPVSDKSGDIVAALENYMAATGVRVLNRGATGLRIEDGIITGVRTKSGVIECRNAVLCTGGVSYPLTGSTGDGLKFAKQAGHTITECRPSLVPLESPDAYCEQMQGFSLKNVTLTAFENEKVIYNP